MTKRKQDTAQELQSRIDFAFSDRIMQENLWRVAIHEAGHAVVATYLGYEAVTVELFLVTEPILEWGGLCKSYRPAKLRSKYSARYIVLAGGVAECLHYGKSLDEIREVIAPHGEEIFSDLDLAGDYRRRDLTYVARILVTHQTALYQFAQELVEEVLDQAS